MKNKNLSISILNVNGLKNKLKDNQFLVEHVDPYSFVFFVETFKEQHSDFNVNNYNSYHSSRKNRNKKSKRASGGIAAYIKNDYCHTVQIINSEHDDLMWIKFKKEFYTIDKDLYFCITYIKPENSSHSETYIDTFEILEKEIIKFSMWGHIMIAGDFNSRIGLLPDYISLDTNIFGNGDPEQVIDNVYNRRFSKDPTVNNAGKRLIDLRLKHNLKIANGRALGDMTGNLTCFKYNGNSIVDYFICSEEIFSKINNFKIKPLTVYSDHCQLVCQFDITVNKQTSIMKNNNILQKIKQKYKWDSGAAIRLKHNLSDDKLEGHQDKIIPQDNINEKINILNEFLDLCSNQCLKKGKHTQNNKVKLKKKAFDNDCYVKKRA